MKEQLIARIQKVIDTNKQHAVLSNWEHGFLESIANQADRRGRLSEKQLEVLTKAEEKCSPSALEKKKEWAELYDAQHRETAQICAQYYKVAGYFTDLCTQVLNNPDFVPSERQYKKMCENKYAQKVLATVKAAPLYPIGSTVVLRTPALSYTNRHLANIPCLVLEVLGAVVTAAKGAKQYRLLPYGGTTSSIFEERQIKKFKKGRKKSSKKIDTYADIPF